MTTKTKLAARMPVCTNAMALALGRLLGRIND